MLKSCIIYNPAAGRGQARHFISAARRSLGITADLWTTTQPQQAETLAKQAAHSGYHRVIAAGGDGTVHEVANGLLDSGQSDIVLGVLPIGSMNDYAAALGIDAEAIRRGQKPTTEIITVDVGIARAGNRERFFVNGLGIGFNGMVTIESRKILGLRGLPLYTLALFQAMIRHFAHPNWEMILDNRRIRSPSLALSVNLGIREGGFQVTPRAELSDGWFDYLHATTLTRWELLHFVPALITGTIPKNHPRIHTGQCRTARVLSDSPLCVHADGELLCVPEDRICEVTVTLIPGRLRVEAIPRHARTRQADHAMNQVPASSVAIQRP